MQRQANIFFTLRTALCKRNFKRKITSAKIHKICRNHNRSLDAATQIRFMYSVQLQKTIVLRMQPRHQATLTQPSRCVLQQDEPIHAAITMRFACARCRTPRESRLCSKRSKPHPPHTRGTFHRRLQPLYTEKHKDSSSGFLPKTNPMQQSCSHYNAICIHTLQNTKGERIVLETVQAAPGTSTRYLSSPAAATLHGKTQGFVLWLPPQNKPHATVMQPLQCILQQHVPIHAAITMRFASTRCRTPRENGLCSKRSKPYPPHTHEVLFIAGCSHFTRKNTRFRAPASSPQHSPCNSHAAITMRFAATRTHPCSHYNAICIHTLQNTKGERIVLETIQTAPAAHTRYCSSPAAATLHGKHKVSCSGFLPKTKPMQQSYSHSNAFCSYTYPSIQPLQCDLHPRFPKSPLLLVSTSLRHHFPSSPLS